MYGILYRVDFLRDLLVLLAGFVSRYDECVENNRRAISPHIKVARDWVLNKNALFVAYLTGNASLIEDCFERRCGHFVLLEHGVLLCALHVIIVAFRAEKTSGI